jgi:hypothetical protein
VFDPYYKWLGIRPEHQPPDHYRLLGLDALESDRDVIQSAAERQMAHVQSFKIGPQSDLSQRILNEIAKAKVCLLNPETKSVYDRTLRQRLSPPPAQPPVAAAPIAHSPPPQRPAVKNPTSVVTASIDDLDAGVPRRTTVSDAEFAPALQHSTRTRTAQRHRRGPSTAVLLGSVGLSLAVLTAAAVFNRESLREQLPPGEASGAGDKGSATQAPVKPEPTNSAASMESSAVLPRVRARRTPTTLKPESSASSSASSSSANLSGQASSPPKPDSSLAKTPREEFMPLVGRARVPTPAAIQQTRKTIDEITTAVDLPDRGSRQPIPIPTRGAVGYVDVLTPAALSPLEFSVQASSDGKSWTVRDGKQAIAMLRYEENLTFAWETGASDQADSLRNALLIVHGDSEPVAVALRRAVEIASPTIELTNSIAKVPIQTSLWGLTPLDLRLEAIGIDRVVLDKRSPEDGKASHGDPAQLVLRDVLPKAAIELSLNGRSLLHVRLAPILETFDHKRRPWSNGTAKSLHESCSKEIDRCSDRIQFLTASIPQMESGISELKGNRANSLVIANAASSLNSAKVELNEQKKLLPVLEQRLRDSQSLLELSKEVHAEASVAFHVYFSVGKCDVAIVRASSKAD